MNYVPQYDPVTPTIVEFYSFGNLIGSVDKATLVGTDNEAKALDFKTKIIVLLNDQLNVCVETKWNGSDFCFDLCEGVQT